MNTSVDDIEKIIRRIYLETLEVTGKELTGTLEDETVLLRSGLDSLGFAILVSRLEEELGYDPFTLMTEPVYPRVYREFVAVYVRFHPDNRDKA